MNNLDSSCLKTEKSDNKNMQTRWCAQNKYLLVRFRVSNDVINRAFSITFKMAADNNIWKTEDNSFIFLDIEKRYGAET